MSERYVAIQYFKEDSPQHNLLKGSVGIYVERFVKASDYEALQRERDQLEDLAYRLVPNSDGPMFKTTWKAEAHKLEQERDELKRENVKWSELVSSFTASQHKYLKAMELLRIENAKLKQETP